MIETERLILRQHQLADFEAMCAMFSDPEVMHHMGGVAISKEDVWNRLLRYHGHWSLLGYGLFAIVEKASGRYIGETGFADFHRSLGDAFDPFPEAAWILTSGAHGHGYAAEAATAAHAWYDARFHPARTVCLIAPANSASLKLAGKLGYHFFGEAFYRGGTVSLLERKK